MTSSEVDQWLGIEEDKERERVMSELLSEQIPHPMYIRTPQGERLLRPMVEELEAKLSNLEQRVEGIPEFVLLPDGRPTNVFEAYIAWKLKGEQAEQRVEGLTKIKDAVAAVKHEIDEGRPQYTNEGLQYAFEALAAEIKSDISVVANEGLEEPDR